jgi:hypothetical protein
LDVLIDEENNIEGFLMTDLLFRDEELYKLSWYFEVLEGGGVFLKLLLLGRTLHFLLDNWAERPFWRAD